MARNFYTMLKKGGEISASIVITQLLRLQQISSGFSTNDQGEEVTLLPIQKSPKFKALLDIVESRGNSKLIVFSHFKWTTTNLYQALSEILGPEAVAVMRGKSQGTRPNETEEEKTRFNTDDDCRVLVAQSTVASESHTLLGSPTCVCHGSVFYENTFVMRTRIQAEGRNHRKGQTLPVDYYDIVASAIEDRIIGALQKKLDLMQIVMEMRL
jgi:ERCC4-related helicase